jgi:hypothetical protein
MGWVASIGCCIYGAAGQTLEVTRVTHSGAIEWVHAATSGFHRVEWAPRPDGPWSSSWTDLVDMPATGSNRTADVAQFYRVVWTEHAAAPTGHVIRIENQLVGSGLGTDIGDPNVYSGILHIDLIAGTVTIVAGGFIFTDNGFGVLATSGGLNGTIEYATGAWSIDFGSGGIADGDHILATYSYSSRTPSEGGSSDAGNVIRIENQKIGEGQGTSIGDPSVYSGILHIDLIPGTVTIVAGGFIFTDDGAGALTTSGGLNGTIEYSTGAWSIDFGSGGIADDEDILATYSYFVGGNPDVGVRVQNEIAAIGSSSKVTYSGRFAHPRIHPATVSLVVGGVILDDSTPNRLTGVPGVAGLVNYTTGTWTLDFGDAPLASDGELIKVSYSYQP